jgi:transposase
MKGRGRNGKQALTAVTHELARIIFGIVKSGKEYDPNFMENRKLTA